MEWQSAPRRPLLVAADYLIDEVPLLEHIRRATGQDYDLVSPIGWATPEYQREYAERLLLRRAARLPSGRREILVCPECADLGCGCISAEVTAEGGCLVWRRVGWENDYESPWLFEMGGFAFPEAEFAGLLSARVLGLGWAGGPAQGALGEA